MELLQNTSQEPQVDTAEAVYIQDSLSARRSFDELLETAESLCFTDTAEVQSQPKVRRGQSDKLGAFARTVALTCNTMRPEQAFQPGMRTIAMDFLRQSPTLQQCVYEKTIGNKIVAFGQRYLAESYSLLGEDADFVVTQFGNSQHTKGDEQALFTWLLQRCKEIDERGGEIANSQELCTPVNLSLRLIGAYPDVQAPPNCLSIGAMAIACLQRVGAEVYYARLLKTESQDMYESIDIITRILCKVSPDMSGALRSKLLEIGATAECVATQHRGFHAGLVVSMPSGRLYSVDPRGAMVSPIEAEQYDALHEKLALLHNQPDDVMVDEPSGFSYETILGNLRDMCCHSETLADIGLDDEEVINLCELLQKPGGTEQIKTVALQWFAGVFNADYFNELCDRAGCARTIDEVIAQTVDCWIFDDLDEVVLQKLYAKSELVRQEIATRLRSLIVISLVAVATYINNNRIAVGQGMLPQEISNAAYGVGVSVLHDMSVKFGMYLPPSFWAAHWASVVPHVELANAHLRGDITLTDSQLAVMRTVFYWVSSVRKLHKTSYDGIIKEFLASTDQLES